MSTSDALERAQFLAARGQLAAASDAVDAILAESPLEVPALLLKGRILLDRREDQEALAVFERAVEIAPRSAEARNGLARCFHLLGRDAEGLESAERARDLLGEAENFREIAPVYLTLVWCLRSLRRLREALAVAEEGLARTPDSVLAQWASVVEEELEETIPDQC